MIWVLKRIISETVANWLLWAVGVCYECMYVPKGPLARLSQGCMLKTLKCHICKFNTEHHIKVVIFKVNSLLEKIKRNGGLFGSAMSKHTGIKMFLLLFHFLLKCHMVINCILRNLKI